MKTIKIFSISFGLFVAGLQLGFWLGNRECNKSIDAAVELNQANCQSQIQESNLNAEKAVIKTKKQNEIIKTSLDSLTIVDRTRLLKQIQDFEATKRNKELVRDDARNTNS